MSSPRRSAAIALWCVLLAAFAGHGAALAQEAARDPLLVQVQPVGETGLEGIALLAPTTGGTAVQLLVMGAPTGTSAVIHPGGCDVPDTTLVALLGDLGAGGQIQTTVPVAFETLTDGSHVVALHPGLDMTMSVGCGTIPAVSTEPDGPVASPAAPAPQPVEVPASQLPVPAPAPPSPDPACLDVVPWVEATEDRFTRISEALSELNAIAGRYDLPAYLAGLASFEGEVGAMISQQAQGPVPSVAVEVNQRAIGDLRDVRGRRATDLRLAHGRGRRQQLRSGDGTLRRGCQAGRRGPAQPWRAEGPMRMTADWRMTVAASECRLRSGACHRGRAVGAALPPAIVQAQTHQQSAWLRANLAEPEMTIEADRVGVGIVDTKVDTGNAAST